MASLGLSFIFNSIIYFIIMPRFLNFKAKLHVHNTFHFLKRDHGLVVLAHLVVVCVSMQCIMRLAA